MPKEDVKPLSDDSTPTQQSQDAKDSNTRPSTTPSETNSAHHDGSGEDELSRCPICQFIEAGECKKAHQDWVACRNEAKAAGKDYIDECQDHFKTFLQCAFDHRDYYEPFLEMLGGLPDGEDEQGSGAPEDDQQQRQEGRPEEAPTAGAAAAVER